MQYSPQQIKDRLLRALDEDNNVVDMAQVLEVISILETYAITREALEQTRIGKTVNDMRKKTKNEGLAKRAKRLVRKWQTLVQASASGDTAATTNGDPTASLQHPNVAMLQGSPRSRPSSPASVHSNISPGLPHSRPGTPLTPGGRVGVNRAQTRPHTPNSVHSNRTNLSPKPGGRPAIPASQKAPSERKLGEITHSLTGPNKGCLVSPSTSGRLASPAVSGRLISPAKSGRVISPASAVSGGLVSSVKSGSARQSPSLDGGQIKKPEKPRVNHSNGNNSMSPALCEDRSDVRKRGRNEVDSDRTTAKRLSVRTPVDNPSLAKQKSAVNGRVKSDTKPSSLKGFVREGDSTLGQTAVQTPASSTPSHGNARDKESLSVKRNINFTMQPKSADVDLPGKDRLVKPPKARVKTTAQIIADLQAKSDTVDKDMVRRIASVEREADDLHQSIVPPGALPRARRKPHESTPLIGGRGRGKLSPNKTELVEKFLQSSVATPSPVEDYTSFRDGDSPPPSASSPCSPVEPVAGPSNSQTQPSEKLVDPLSLLPPLDLEEIVWDEEEGYEVREREITDADLERISDERWVGVNGCYNSAGQWRDWTQTFSSQTFGDEMLHILPYVNIDD